MSVTGAVERVFRGRRVATVDGIHPATIHVAAGRIVRVSSHEDVPAGLPVTDAGDAVIFPGLVDTHVHVNDPGRADWEGFETATRAAAAGGVTTLLDMPLNSVPPTTTLAGLEAKRAAARGRIAVDVGLLGGVTPVNAGDLVALHRDGVFGFKGFLCPSGVDEFPDVAPADLGRILPVLAAEGALLMAHAELPGRITAPSGDPRRYATWLATRPVEAETEAVALLIELAHATGARVHVVHVSAAETLGMITAARARGVRISAETCPHYLTFAAEEIPDGATEYKCAPPVRHSAVREALWGAVGRGAVEAIVSDHSPAPPGLKLREKGDFLRAWGGIASLQLRLPAVWTGARARGYGLEQLADWLAAGPARLVDLDRRKGVLAPGRDADLVIWDPEAEFVVDAAGLRHRHPMTPYHGRRLAGVVRETYLRGERVYCPGTPDGPATGRLLSRLDP